ncbi:uncharacterized protein TNCV_4669131 [Trichonephila clavipes]|nr:uncharacterized protein TNCV_4669131 [Trichonephila clavipes]
MNDKFAQFCVRAKKRTEVVFPHPSESSSWGQDSKWEEKGERGHHVNCVICVKKLDDWPPLRFLNLPTFRLGVLSPQTREHLSKSECLNQMHKEGKSFVKEKKEKPAASPVEKVTKRQKNSANSSSSTAKSPSEYMREYRVRKKNCKILS